MNFAENSVKNVLLPKLKKDLNFDVNKMNAAFWSNFTSLMLNYESDVKSIYTAIYQLELENAEKIISKLPLIYDAFIKDVAENYVIGNKDEASKFLIQTKSKRFESEVQNFKNIEKAVKNVERRRIKTILPFLYDELSFELTDKEIEIGIKKKERESLKEKMNVWKREMEENDGERSTENKSKVFFQKAKTENVAPENKQFKKEVKIISLSWFKYAAAACVLMIAGVFYFKAFDASTTPDAETIVKIDDKKQDSIEKSKQQLPNTLIELAYETSLIKNTVLSPTNSLGFAGSKKANVIEIQLNDASKMIMKINDKIKEEIINGKVAGDGSTINALKIQLKEITLKQGNYEFDGKKLILYSRPEKETIQIITTDGKSYFLQRGSLFYKLQITETDRPLIQISDAETKEKLNKIVFDNE